MRWTPASEQRLIAAWNSGDATAPALAERFSTTRGAINQKIRELRVTGVQLRWIRKQRVKATKLSKIDWSDGTASAQT